MVAAFKVGNHASCNMAPEFLSPKFVDLSLPSGLIQAGSLASAKTVAPDLFVRTVLSRQSQVLLILMRRTGPGERWQTFPTGVCYAPQMCASTEHRN